MEETSFEVYQGSKLKKLMELIKFAMQVNFITCSSMRTHTRCSPKPGLKKDIWEELVSTAKVFIPPQSHFKGKSVLKDCVCVGGGGYSLSMLG